MSDYAKPNTDHLVALQQRGDYKCAVLDAERRMVYMHSVGRLLSDAVYICNDVSRFADESMSVKEYIAKHGPLVARKHQFAVGDRVRELTEAYLYDLEDDAKPGIYQNRSKTAGLLGTVLSHNWGGCNLVAYDNGEIEWAWDTWLVAAEPRGLKATMGKEQP